MDAIEYLGALRRRWPIIVGAVVLGLAAGFITNAAVSSPSESASQGSVQPATSYTSTALLLNTAIGSNLPGLSALDNETIARLSVIGEIPERVARRINYEGPATELAQQVDILPEENSGLIEVTVISSDANRARRLSNVYAEEMQTWFKEHQREIGTATSEVYAEQLNVVGQDIAALNAEIESNPEDEQLLTERDAKLQAYEFLSAQYQQVIESSAVATGLEFVVRGIPQPVLGADYAVELAGPQGRFLRLLLAGLLGLVIGAGIALFMERVDTRIRSKQDAEAHFGAPVLAEIPHLMRRDRGDMPVAAARPTSLAADAFRVLATSIQKRDPKSSWESRPKIILVTSGGHGEGKSTVVANLAASFAEMGQKVLTVSCDFRHPRLHELLGVSSTPGLSDAIQASNGKPVIHRDNVLTSSFHDFVGVIPTGTVPDKPGELLSSEAMKRALGEARQIADVVLLDTSPLPAGDAGLLLDEVDAVVVVARAGQTNANEAIQTAGLLARLRAPVRGVVLSDTENSSFGTNGSDGLFKGFSLLARHSKGA